MVKDYFLDIFWRHEFCKTRDHSLLWKEKKRSERIVWPTSSVQTQSRATSNTFKFKYKCSAQTNKLNQVVSVYLIKKNPLIFLTVGHKAYYMKVNIKAKVTSNWLLRHVAIKRTLCSLEETVLFMNWNSPENHLCLGVNLQLLAYKCQDIFPGLKATTEWFHEKLCMNWSMNWRSSEDTLNKLRYPFIIGLNMRHSTTHCGWEASLIPDFISTFRPAVDTNPSRKRNFSKTLFKPEEFENAGFAFLRGQQ